jgi:hypothetical protein
MSPLRILRRLFGPKPRHEDWSALAVYAAPAPAPLTPEQHERHCAAYGLLTEGRVREIVREELRRAGL